ncbi:MAG: hypothetical protein GQ468_01510 [Candidatus Scalindua sp.]|nr:hypothetical protein [Candidatus Scalindua sp.]
MILLIISTVSIKDVNTFGISHVFADTVIRDNKDYGEEIEEIKIRIELLRREIEIRQNKRYMKSINYNSDKPQRIYTIQVSSFFTFARAQNDFNSLVEVLSRKYRSFLRVEKVGTSYTVRLGKFESYSSAENFIKPIATIIPNPLILKSFITYERLRSCICY